MNIRMPDPGRESKASVFVARNSADETAAEQAFAEAGIEYTVTTEGTEKSDGAVCFLAIVYQVAEPEAEQARAVLEARGLGHGILPARG